MTSSVESWSVLTTPISALSLNHTTRPLFTYFVILQAAVVGALYKKRNVEPILALIGIYSLVLLGVYSMYDNSFLHNIFAITFFLVQPVIFFVEYKKKNNISALVKSGFLAVLTILVWQGVLPLPVFEFITYGALIMFL